MVPNTSLLIRRSHQKDQQIRLRVQTMRPHVLRHPSLANMRAFGATSALERMRIERGDQRIVQQTSKKCLNALCRWQIMSIGDYDVMLGVGSWELGVGSFLGWYGASWAEGCEGI